MNGGVQAAGAAPAAPALGLRPRVRADRVFAVTIAALVGLAWLSLVLWQQSPYARLLGHEEIEHTRLFGHDYLVLLVVFVAGWTLMTVAMMLPTSLPLVAFFRSLVRERADHTSLTALLLLGYLGVWIAFAALAHLNDQFVHHLVDRVGWLEANAWIIAAGTFALAGAYQFSALKHRCLDKCRSPVAFTLSHWRGRRARREALALGLRHGLFCLGCCWSLMLLMFGVGVGSIGWMLMLAAVMAVEKNAAWGRRLSAPVGVTLLGWAAVLVAQGTAGAF
jgi:predicted metal-binding membrane protein